MFQKLKTLNINDIINMQLKSDNYLFNCKITENDTDKKLLTIHQFDKQFTVNYVDVLNFKIL
jgi:hypothetical protein